MVDSDRDGVTIGRGFGDGDPHSWMNERRAPLVVACFLLLVYVLTLAPSVTYWDSGEFLAAIKTLGIPHPPGTPLYILVANVWGRALGPVFGFAWSINLLSAVSTAVACGILAWLLARWTRDAWIGVAGGILAGLMSSVWLNANETEVYAPSLLLSALLLLVAERARVEPGARWLVLLAYLVGLGYSLQLSSLVAAPAAVMLALSGERRGRFPALCMAGAALLGASAILFMIVRAQHDPGINQGNPATWGAFVDVVTRAQYQPVSILPRQAPWYLQIGNVFEYADWQVALGLSPEAPPGWLRTPFTLIYATLGALGCALHRKVHRPSWRVMLFLFVCGTLGVIAYLNMKASPSYGYGFLPPAAKHEARERDYFFVIAFVCWGMWAGMYAMHALSRFAVRGRVTALAVVALPAVLNWSAVDRSREPIASAARDSAMRVLGTVPPRAVVFAYGDNDTYPGWYLQQVEGVRRDVTLVTIPLLGAGWYRAEVARRDGLLPNEMVESWRGFGPTLTALCGAAARRGRAVVAVPVRDRPAIPFECERR